MKKYQRGEGEIGVLAVVVLIVLTIVGLFWAWPKYNVYSSRMSGQAQLAESLASKQVKVQEALAAKESAQSYADAEIIRAGGVAKANQIIGNSLKDNEAYLRYLFVNNLENTKNQIIYVPTEANLPILEARRSTQVTAGEKP